MNHYRLCKVCAMPNQEQVRLIFKDTYLFYIKYINLSNADIDWSGFRKDYIALGDKYPYDLTVSILNDLIKIIGKEKGGL